MSMMYDWLVKCGTGLGRTVHFRTVVAYKPPKLRNYKYWAPELGALCPVPYKDLMASDGPADMTGTNQHQLNRSICCMSCNESAQSIKSVPAHSLAPSGSWLRKGTVLFEFLLTIAGMPKWKAWWEDVLTIGGPRDHRFICITGPTVLREHMWSLLEHSRWKKWRIKSVWDESMYIYISISRLNTCVHT